MKSCKLKCKIISDDKYTDRNGNMHNITHGINPDITDKDFIYDAVLKTLNKQNNISGVI